MCRPAQQVQTVRCRRHKTRQQGLVKAVQVLKSVEHAVRGTHVQVQRRMPDRGKVN